MLTVCDSAIDQGLRFIWVVSEAQVVWLSSRRRVVAISWQPMIHTEVSDWTETNYSCATQNITMETLWTQLGEQEHPGWQ